MKTLRLLVFSGLLAAPVLTLAAPLPAYQQDPLANTLIFDVRNGDQQGKLLFKDNELAFESLTDARHSRKWKYADIREISKKRREVSVRPFKGDKYSFQLQDNGMRDRLYKLISDRVLAARQGRP